MGTRTETRTFRRSPWRVVALGFTSMVLVVLAACSTPAPSTDGLDTDPATRQNVVVVTEPRARVVVLDEGSRVDDVETMAISTDAVVTTYRLEPGTYDVRLETQTGVWTDSLSVPDHGTVGYLPGPNTASEGPMRFEVDGGADRTLPAETTASLTATLEATHAEVGAVIGWRQEAGPAVEIHDSDRAAAWAGLTRVGTYRFAFGVDFGVHEVWDRVEIVVTGSRDGPSEDPEFDRTPAPSADDGDYYVAIDGDDGAPGSMDRPFATIQKAIDVARPGDVLLVRGGVYVPSEPIRIQDSGLSSSRIQLAAFPGEHVTIDGSGFSKTAGLVSLTASYWTLTGFEIRNGSYSGVLLKDAHHNELAGLDVHHNGWSGVHLDANTSANLIVDTASHHNYDAVTGGTHADGFAVKHRSSTNNTFVRTRAFHNSDDGFDLLESGPQRIDRSVAYRNGFRDSGTPYSDGDGNGFKLGIGASDRWQAGGGHLVTRSVAWGNLYMGFTSNDGTVPIVMVHNTAFDNGRFNFFFGDAAHVLRNNLSSGAVDDVKPMVAAEANSWQLGLVDPGFRSTDPLAEGFLHLAESSAAVDAGMALEAADYAGDAPDLGAFEFGLDASFSAGYGRAWSDGAALR